MHTLDESLVQQWTNPTLADLIKSLSEAQEALKAIAPDTTPLECYVDSDGEPCIIQLVEKSLSDGSKVYDVRIFGKRFG